ncbi:MAG: FKBP-type peptidyl-prolyl cis-trans isomerase [Myxococcales bacterium]
MKPLPGWVLIAAVTFAFVLLGESEVRADPRPSAPALTFEPIEPLPSTPRPRAPAAPAEIAEAPADANMTSSGLASKILAKGKGGAHPGPHDRVIVHYTGWTSSGHTFDSSIPNGEPTTLALDAVIAGWTEGVQLMARGEKRRFWIPSGLAYGDKSTRSDAPAGAVVFDIELVDFVATLEPPQVPVDVDAAPKDAKKTASGLAYKILKRGKNKQHPVASSAVEVHYSGWTPDGKMFDSSVARGKTTTFRLDGVIKGWTEGVQLMAVGDKARFWIPGNLAYGDKPARDGTPTGPLVFDIELLSIK